MCIEYYIGYKVPVVIAQTSFLYLQNKLSKYFDKEPVFIEFRYKFVENIH